MAGVNLSQSMASTEKLVKRPFFASGFSIGIVFIVLTLVGWGGLRFYISTLDKKISQLAATLSTSEGELRGTSVDRVVDFDARLSLLGADPAERVDPQSILTALEALIVPEVVLTKYEYNKQEKTGVIVGKTDNFRFLAEQIISLKSDLLFSQVNVDSINRTDDGKVLFTLKAHF